MIIGIFGESCTGKSSIAAEISRKINVKIYTGKDYVKLAKNEVEAKKQFSEILKSNQSTTDIIIYIISEKEHLQLLPEHTVRVLVTADLNIIKERFAKRMNGVLPDPIAAMLDKKHGSFNNEKYDLHIVNVNENISDICNKIINLCGL